MINIFKEFDLHNRITCIDHNYYNQFAPNVDIFAFSNPKLEKIFDIYAGCSISRGLFRFHTIGSSSIWTNIITTYFGKYKGLVCCFAFDWMGRQFGISKTGEYIYMFDPATGEVLELQEAIDTFLNEDLVKYKNETFNCELFTDILDLYGKDLEFNKCFGFKVLLFLGGKDELKNYEITDMEVYWEMNYQIFNQINKLPPSKLINNVDFK